MKSPLSHLFKTPVAELLSGFTDWHCHILPGVDDGFRTVEDSLEMLALYEKAGVRAVWFTPHIMEDLPNGTTELKEAFETLKSAYSGSVMLNLASENMLDFLFERRLADGDLLPLPGRRILVETSFYNPPAGFDETLRKIKYAGYFPVLAHPERYMYLDNEGYRSLHDSGVKFQLNLPSFTGLYGEEVKTRAEWLSENGLCDFAGTNLHSAKEFSLLTEGYVGRKHADALQGRL